MKIAAICDFPYWERKIGSAVRFDSVCRSVSRHAELTVICSVSLPSTYFQFCQSAPYEIVDRARLKEIDAGLPQSWVPGLRRDRQMTVRSIKHVVEEGSFDAVIIPYFNRSWMIDGIDPSVVRIIDTIDCQSQRTRSFALQGMSPTFQMTPEEEGKALDAFDLILSISDEDSVEFSEITERPIVTAPFRLSIPDISERRKQEAASEDNRELLFIAARSEVNDLTLNFLLTQILPLVPGQVTLNIVGNVTVPSYYPENTTVVRHKNLDDIIPIYSKVALAVNPTFAGGGVKTKTLEAISLGVPIITTDEGARGLRPLVPDSLIVNDKESFAYMIGYLLDRPEELTALSKEILLRVKAEASNAWVPVFVQLVSAIRIEKTAKRAG
ncbi:Glycosyl transferases group 1 [Poseidonocella pacifica]|uniref:Glycosyl transferases group 1 n=1 Tax=Poseidonocella pacifica TaxID=871651 RepID=A0A1I0XVS8_9RHOB|nr:glycosyltransferase family 4 protein [Poseidonocella pacifica]SFB04278.1 Glycosyl transferases group 1 [Poseidonocella pacifica]